MTQETPNIEQDKSPQDNSPKQDSPPDTPGASLHRALRIERRKVRELERKLQELTQQLEQRDAALKQALGIDTSGDLATQLERVQAERERLEQELRRERLMRMWAVTAADAHDPELAFRAVENELAGLDPSSEEARDTLQQLVAQLRETRPYLFRGQTPTVPESSKRAPGSEPPKRTFTRSEIRELLRDGGTPEVRQQIYEAIREGRVVEQ